MRTAIVTGASRGLGRAVARALAREGWHLIVDARHRPQLDEVAAELQRVTEVTAIGGDVASPAHRAELAAAAARAGRVDLLLNNAGALGPSPLPPLARLDAEDLLELLRVNAVAPIALFRQVLPQLRTAGGAVVNITSDVAVEAHPGWGGYAASKAALERLTAVLAVEHPELAVYAFDPGDLRTRMHQDAFPGEDISDRPEPESAVPALLRLLDRRPAGWRLRAADLAVPAEVRP